MTFQGYNNAPDQSRGGKKKAAIIGVSSLILVAMVVAVAVGVGKSKSGTETTSSSGEISASTKAIKALCQPTDYKQTCETTLTSTAGNVSDPKELIKTAFQIAMNQINEAAKNSTMLKELASDPRTSQALENCHELMVYSIDELQSSFDQIGDFQITKLDEYVENLKVWISAALTYQETCLDGFENTTGNAGEQMKKALKTAGELTRNGLAMVSEISSLLSAFDLSDLRRGLAETAKPSTAKPSNATVEIPAWVTDDKRKLMTLTAANINPDAVVAKDGSGKYKTITEALQAIPKKGNSTFIIYIKAGVYQEQVMVNKTMGNVMMIGDGPTKTKVTFNKNYIDGTQTMRTATFSVVANGFLAKDMGFENSAGAIKHQAVALRVQSDNAIFYNCQMDGYQDTLYAHAKRQFYRDCTISGTIDFIFGDAAAVFQNCTMVVRKPLANQANIVTAQGRIERREPTGFVLQNCKIEADPLLAAEPNGTFRSFLARPWKEYSRAVIMQSQIDAVIDPEGWLPWLGDFALNTCFFTEFGNRGPGSVQTGRVKWQGIKTISSQHAPDFTAATFIQGDKWIPATGVPYSPGMMNV